MLPVRPKSAEPDRTVVWWEAETVKIDSDASQREPESLHSVLFPHVQALEEDQCEVHVQNMLNARMFSNRELMTFEWRSQIATSLRPVNANLENGIQSVCETLQSRIGTHRPKPTITTRGADFDVYLKGRQLDRYLWGLFEAQQVYPKGERVFLDAAVYGNGFLKIDIDRTEGEIFTERVHPDEIVVDQRECVSGAKPMCMYQRKLVSRLWLQRTYGGEKNKVVDQLLREAQGANFRYTSYRSPTEEQLVVIEAWKLPTRPGAGDGRHVICTDTCTLLDEKYDRDCFPFVWLYWNPPETGFYGRALVSDLIGYQVRLNHINELLMYGQDLMCVPRILLEKGSQILVSQLDNQVAKILEYRGVKPEALTWNAFNAEMYNERDRIRASMFEFAGLSQMVAQAKPLTSQMRFDSSEAIREFSSMQDERYNHKVQALERFYLEVAKHYIELSAKLYKDLKRDTKVFFRSRYLVQQINWSEVDLQADQYVMQIGASSVLNLSPAGRKDILNFWLDRGLITKQQYYALSGQPDLEKLTDQLAAAHDYVEFQIDKMLHGEAQTPTPFNKLAEDFTTVHDTLLRLMVLDTPAEIIQLFEAWLLTAKHYLQPETEGQTELVDPQAPLAADPMAASAAGPTPMPMDPAMAGAPTPPEMMPDVAGAVPGVV